MVFKPGNTEKTKKAKEKTPEVTIATDAPKGDLHKAFAIEKKSNGHWVLHIYDVQDGKILAVKSGEAEPKALSIERFKIQFVQHYILGKN